MRAFWSFGLGGFSHLRGIAKLFKSPRSVFALRFVNGLNSILATYFFGGPGVPPFSDPWDLCVVETWLLNWGCLFFGRLITLWKSSLIPIGFMYGIYLPYTYLHMFMVNVGRYTMHWFYGFYFLVYDRCMCNTRVSMEVIVTIVSWFISPIYAMYPTYLWRGCNPFWCMPWKSLPPCQNGGSFRMMINPKEIMVVRKPTFKKWWFDFQGMCNSVEIQDN